MMISGSSESGCFLIVLYLGLLAVFYSFDLNGEGLSLLSEIIIRNLASYIFASLWLVICIL